MTKAKCAGTKSENVNLERADFGIRMEHSAMRRLLCSLVRAYQLFVSPLLPRTCRFQPSCSEYMIQAITEYGAWRGMGKGLWRLLRCQPFARGGYDPVIPKREFKMQNAECKMQNDLEHASVFSAPSAVRK